MATPTLPLPIPNGTPGGAGPITPTGATYADFTPQTTNFNGLVASVLGDNADPSDGWDAGFEALMQYTATLDAADAAGDTLLDAITTPLDAFLAIGDDIGAVLSVGLAAEPAFTSALESALASTVLPAVPSLALSLLALPGVPNIVAPALADITQVVTGLLQGVTESLEDMVDQDMQDVLSQLGVDYLSGLPSWDLW